MNDFLYHIDKFQLHTIFSMFVMLSFFYFMLRKEIKEDISKQDEKIEQQGKRIDRLYEMFVDLLKNMNK